MMKKLLYSIILINSFLVNKSFGWGKTGHRIVGELAEQRLSKKSKQKIEELIGKDSLAKVSTWPDEIRSDPKMQHTTPWHYVSIPNGQKYFQTQRSTEGDILKSLVHFEDVLRDAKESKENKIEAIKFLVHFIGDLHQPLHVGLADDRGGNSIRVKWFKTETNLHAVWDEDLVDFEKLSFSEYAKFLGNYSKLEIENWSKGNFFDWANESMDLRPLVYDFKTEGLPNLSYEYNFKVKPKLEERLKQAGIRLAYCLNKIFENVKLTEDELEIRKKIGENKIEESKVELKKVE